jgi:hypothetical protein
MNGWSFHTQEVAFDALQALGTKSRQSTKEEKQTGLNQQWSNDNIAAEAQAKQMWKQDAISVHSAHG